MKIKKIEFLPLHFEAESENRFRDYINFYLHYWRFVKIAKVNILIFQSGEPKHKTLYRVFYTKLKLVDAA